MKFPDGTIVQWGYLPLGPMYLPGPGPHYLYNDIVLPKPYSSNNYSAIATIQGKDNDRVWMTAQTSNKTNSGFRILQSGWSGDCGDGTYWSWIAIGK